MIQGVTGPDLRRATRAPHLDGEIRLILDEVIAGNIVVLEKGLSPEESSKLIEMTMMEINPDGFSGIEMETYPPARRAAASSPASSGAASRPPG